MRGHGAIPELGMGGGIPEVVAPLEQGAAATMAGGGRPLGQGARLGALLGARRGRG